MLLTLALILFVWGLADLHEARAIDRHEESMEFRRLQERNRREAQRKREEQQALLEARAKKKVTRTYARDEKGRFVAQETVEDL